MIVVNLDIRFLAGEDDVDTIAAELRQAGHQLIEQHAQPDPRHIWNRVSVTLEDKP